MPRLPVVACSVGGVAGLALSGSLTTTAESVGWWLAAGLGLAAVTAAVVVRSVGAADWDALVATLDATRQEVRRYWAEVTSGDAA